MKNTLDKLKRMAMSVLGHKRMLSLYWAIGAMTVAELAVIIPEQLSAYDVPEFVVIFAGLILAQITKALNNHYTKE